MINLDNVTKTFGSRVAVDQVSLNFEHQRTHVLLGSSGCGKTTILRLILGLLMPDTGSIHIDGTIVNATTQAMLVKKMGYVVQDGGLFPHLNAYRNVTLAAEAQQWPKDRVRQRVQHLSTMVGFDDAVLQRYPSQLSGGQRQRVGLMRSLMLDPPVLLLDEPLGALDPIVRADLQGQLKAIFTTLRKTVVLVTHDIREAAIFGHTITLMTEGKVVQRGTFAELVKQPIDPFVSAFMQAQKPPSEMTEHL